MTDEQINVKIAEWCGWEYCEGNAATMHPGTWEHPENESRFEPPDYLTDRNECSEFEWLVEERGLWRPYTSELLHAIQHSRRRERLLGQELHLCSLCDEFCVATARAHQRCEALLKVIGEAKT